MVLTKKKCKSKVTVDQVTADPTTNPLSLLRKDQQAMSYSIPDISSPCDGNPADKRNLDSLSKESSKKSSDPETVNVYLDLLLGRRRTQIQESSIDDRLSIIETDYKTMETQPDQVKLSKCSQIY